jgi:hypothetical protein
MKFSIFNPSKKRPDDMLPDGWQFYSRPNNLELPGTIFRIDRDGKRFIVDHLRPQTSSSPEPGGSKVESIATKTGVVARLLGLEPLSTDLSAGRTKVLQYEITGPVRVSTSDAQIDKVLTPALKALKYLPKNRYYVVREVRSATALRFTLTSEQIGELGAKAAVMTGVQAGITFSEKNAGTYELTQAFPERLGVMFLPDEILPARAGLSRGPATLGRQPVTRVLDWSEADAT